MPISDYNNKKQIEVTSTNNSGTTQDKAQPLLLVDGDDSTTGTGDIVIDFANISDAQDIAVYDQNGNLLDYEIEELDTTNNTAVLWAYNNWTRDDTVQAQIAYGDNSANTDRQNVTGTWNNTGQNAEGVYHMQNTSGAVTDSSPNQIDSSSVNVTSRTANGEFDGADEFDGTDDTVQFPEDNAQDLGAAGTVVFNAITPQLSPDGESNEWAVAKQNFFDGYNIGANATDGIRHFIRDGDGDTLDVDAAVSDITDGNFHTHVAAWDANDSTMLRSYVDAVEEGTATVSGFSGAADVSSGLYLGDNSSDDGNLEMTLDEARLYSEKKTAEWIQADYDASPKAGQVFFSQQAAETKETVTTPETVLTQITENPQVQAGTASLTIQETQITSTNPDITLEPGVSRIQVTATALTQTTENPTVNATFDVSIPETQLTVSNPNPGITVGETVIVPETQLTATNPNIQVTPGDSAVTVPETQLTASNPDIALNRSIVFGVVTQLNATNPEPNLEPGIVQTNIPETQLTQTTVNPQVEPGETQVQVTSPTELTVFTPDIKVTPGNTDLGIDETVLLQTTPEPNLGLDLQFVSPTNALITNNNRYFDMPNHTFKQNDFGDTFTATLKDGDNPNGVSIQGNTGVNLVVETFDGKKVLDKEMNVTDAQNGKVEYEWETGDFIEDVGVYKAEIKVFDASDEPETFPNNGYRSITVEDELE